MNISEFWKQERAAGRGVGRLRARLRALKRAQADERNETNPQIPTGQRTKGAKR